MSGRYSGVRVKPSRRRNARWGGGKAKGRRISMEYVALLRGINVGGTNKVVMSELEGSGFFGPFVLRGLF